MCLYTKDSEPKVAQTDIKAYKCFRSVREVYSSKPYRDMTTLFLGCPITHEEATGKVPLIGKNHKEPRKVTSFDTEWTEVGSGYIHAFTDRETAVHVMKNNFIGRDWYFPVVAEVTIPKGTVYYEGIDNKGFNTYAAEKMVVNGYHECLVDNKILDYTSYVAVLEKTVKAREKQVFE